MQETENNKNINKDIQYSIFDPTGNITALVETPVDAGGQPAVSAQIMRLHPEVEQVGFVRFDMSSDVPVELRMAGGEFCGNATMSAAAMYAIKRESCTGHGLGSAGTPEEIFVNAAGISDSVRVRLTRKGPDEFEAGVLMPPAISIESRELECSADRQTTLGIEPVVRMQGIDHIIVTRDSELYSLRETEEIAGAGIRELCGQLGSDCLGLMFFDENRDECRYSIKPLVYVPGVDTIFWENSCASGTAAAGMYLSAREGRPVDITADEPAGKLRVTSDPATGETWLYGTTRRIRCSLSSGE